jgi:hypothetical protein
MIHGLILLELLLLLFVAVFLLFRLALALLEHVLLLHELIHTLVV